MDDDKERIRELEEALDGIIAYAERAAYDIDHTALRNKAYEAIAEARFVLEKREWR